MKKQQHNAGFTLIEVVIAALISTVILGVFSVFAVYFFQSYQFSFDENVAITHAEDAVRQMIGQIRETRPSDNGSYSLVSTDDQEFTFYADFDNDSNAERVRYFLESGSLKRGIIEPVGIPAQYPQESETVRIIADYIQNGADPLFYYYNEDWPGDTVNNPLSPDVRLLETTLVSVFVRVDVDPNTEPSAFELSSSTHLRNLKTNL